MDDIILEFKKELNIYKKHFSKIREMEDSIYEKLYLYFKNLEIVDLLKERYEYGFCLDFDLNRLLKKKENSLQLNIEPSFKEVDHVPILNTQEFIFEYDEELLDFVSKETISNFAFIFKKKKIYLSDLPNLLSFLKNQK